MRYLVVGVCVVASWAGDVLPASAAWNNVFQPTLFSRCRPSTSRSSPVVAAYVAPVAVAAPVDSSCAPCQQQACSTSYTQRCYYQPVTTYQSQSYYEPVTTYQTSYYYEPVTTYRYSSYYDPCTCCYKQVATPCTSYQLKAQSCPVQSWVQRCAQVPVTSYQKSCYLEPKTTCCQTTTGALIPMGAAAVAAPPAPQIQAVPQAPATTAPPVINENHSTTPPAGGYDRYYPPSSSSSGSNMSWMPAPKAKALMPPAKAPAPPAPSVKLERIVFGADTAVEGQIVRSDNTPRPDAKVLFVSADHAGVEQRVVANGAGRFSVSLAPGGWLVYLTAVDGNPIFHSRIDVNDQQTTQIRLVNR